MAVTLSRRIRSVHEKSPIRNAPAVRCSIQSQNSEVFGVPYGSRTRVAAVKEKRPIVIQWDLAAWIALYRTSRTHENSYWTFNGRAKDVAGVLLRRPGSQEPNGAQPH